MDLTAPALVACDYAVQVPAVNAPDYMDVLMKTIERDEVDLVFSLNDLELELLSKKRDLIHERTGALVYVPTLESLQVCIDKWATFQFAQRMGIVAPQTWLSVDEALLAIEQSKGQFPLMVKPRDRKSTRLNSSHVAISYAVFCLKKKKNLQTAPANTTTGKGTQSDI